MLQLLVEGRDQLEVGQLIPLGDFWDAINMGDGPLTDLMRTQFSLARRLWSGRLLSMLLRDHGLDDDAVADLPPRPSLRHRRPARQVLAHSRVGPRGGATPALTVSRLTALNSGVVRAFVPGTERQQVLERLRRWAAEVGELKLGDDEQDPTVTVALSGVDTAPILEAAGSVDNDGERRRKVKEMLVDALQVKGSTGSLDLPRAEVTWRGTRREVAVVFGNVRDPVDLPDELLRTDTRPRVVIDFPWDVEGYHPSDDRTRAIDYSTTFNRRADRPF
jgi:hypothetical protein